MPNTHHILNGDALLDRFVATGLEGETIIMREALISGPLFSYNLEDFYERRAKYISGNDIHFYYRHTASQIEKIVEGGKGEFNLWFGYDLFCQANMWFLLYLLSLIEHSVEVYVVYPSHLKKEDRWRDFGGAKVTDLLDCFKNRIPFNRTDLHLGKDLWLALSNDNMLDLERLSKQSSACFPYLAEVCQAQIDRYPIGNGRPEKVVEEIIAEGASDFSTVFVRFYEREGVYGFGDVQLKEIYDNVVRSKQ